MCQLADMLHGLDGEAQAGVSTNQLIHHFNHPW
jgi:hypothetical protein